MDLKKITECPDCASTNIVYNDQREQIICRDCGLIFEPYAVTTPTNKTTKKPAKKTKKPVKKAKSKKRR